MEKAGDPMVPQTEWMLAQAPNGGRPFTIAETFELNVERERFRKRVGDHWNATKDLTTSGRTVDAILSPVASSLAPPHDTTRWWGYTSYWNLCDYPAAVFPTGFHHAGHHYSDEMATKPRNPVEAYIHSQWNSRTYDNAPISLQVVGRRLNEEKLLHVLFQVDDALVKFKQINGVDGINGINGVNGVNGNK
jgi:amidase